MILPNIIMSRMRGQTLVHLHESHQWVVWTKQRVWLTVYWPGIDNNIDNMVVACKHCQNHLPSNSIPGSCWWPLFVSGTRLLDSCWLLLWLAQNYPHGLWHHSYPPGQSCHAVILPFWHSWHLLVRRGISIQGKAAASLQWGGASTTIHPHQDTPRVTGWLKPQ